MQTSSIVPKRTNCFSCVTRSILKCRQMLLIVKVVLIKKLEQQLISVLLVMELFVFGKLTHIRNQL